MISGELASKLKKISDRVETNIRFEQRDESVLQNAIGISPLNDIAIIGKLLSCVDLLLLENDEMRLQIKGQLVLQQKLRAQIETLEEENRIMRNEMEAYNGVLLQRARVKSGTRKPAAKAKPTKAEVQSLLEQGYSRDKVAELYGISRTTIWRICKD